MQVGGPTLNDYIPLTTPSGAALVRRGSVDEIANLDSIIFDVDGVIFDISESIMLVHGLTAEHYFGSLGWTNCAGLVTSEDINAFKLAGGFNGDWELAFSWQLLYLFKAERHGMRDGALLKGMEPTIEHFTAMVGEIGGYIRNAEKVIRRLATEDEWRRIELLWDRAKLQRVFQETYCGDLCPQTYGFEQELVPGPGLIRDDRLMLDRTLLPKGLKLGVASGRTLGEIIVSFRLAGLSDDLPAERIVSVDDGVKKPDPEVLRLAVERTGGVRPMYVGDQPDDHRTVVAYRELGLPMLSCAVLTGLRHPEAKPFFEDNGVDLIADNVNAAMHAVTSIILDNGTR